MLSTVGGHGGGTRQGDLGSSYTYWFIWFTAELPRNFPSTGASPLALLVTKLETGVS